MDSQGQESSSSLAQMELSTGGSLARTASGDDTPVGPLPDAASISENQPQGRMASSVLSNKSISSSSRGSGNGSGNYRERPSFIDSSSPSHDHRFLGQDAGANAPKSELTPPSSPQSPSLHSKKLPSFGRSASNAADPFSGNAKAPSMSHHPSFSKQFPHAKHPHPSRTGQYSPQKKLAGKKRALEGSPQQPRAASRDPILGDRVSASSSSQLAVGALGSGGMNARGSGMTEVFGAFFHDSDGAGTSSDDGGFDWRRGHDAAHPSLEEHETARSRLSGLGLGSAFGEENGRSASAGLNARTGTLARQGSHPYEAFGSALPPRPRSPPTSTTVQDAHSSLVGSPSSRAPAARRARLTGSSPTQLTVARTGRFLPNAGSDADDELPNAHGQGTNLFAKHFSADVLDRQAARPLRAWERYETLPTNQSAELVSRALAKAFDSSKPVVDLGGLGLTHLTPAIAELGDYVGIHPLSNTNSERFVSRSFSRANTSDSINLSGSANDNGSPASASTVAGNNLASPPRSVSQPIRKHLDESHPSATQLFLYNNSLGVLPSALFAVQNLRVLSLRKNGISELPPAIGMLRNLRELNIGDNDLRYLPAEIQELSLTTFNYHPNPFMRPPEGARLILRPVRGQLTSGYFEHSDALDAPSAPPQSSHPPPLVEPMGPPPLPPHVLAARQSRLSEQGNQALRSHFPDLASYVGSSARTDDLLAPQTPLNQSASSEAPVALRRRNYRASLLGELVRAHNGVPSLRDLCTRRLLGPADDDVDSYPIQPRKRRKMTLIETLENGTLREMSAQSMLNEVSLKQLESARRTATKSWNSRPELPIAALQPPKDPPGGQSNPFGKRKFRTWASGAEVFTQDASETRPSSDVLAQMNQTGDDARANPWFNRCPNPAHAHRDVRRSISRDSESEWPLDPSVVKVEEMPIFQEAVERQIEWVSHIGGHKVVNIRTELPDDAPESLKEAAQLLGPIAANSGCLPVLWRGCSRGCLEFLKETM